jgi:hypothetical protein
MADYGASSPPALLVVVPESTETGVEHDVTAATSTQLFPAAATDRGGDSGGGGSDGGDSAAAGTVIARKDMAPPPLIPDLESKLRHRADILFDVPFLEDLNWEGERGESPLLNTDGQPRMLYQWLRPCRWPSAWALDGVVGHTVN